MIQLCRSHFTYDRSQWVEKTLVFVKAGSLGVGGCRLLPCFIKCCQKGCNLKCGHKDGLLFYISLSLLSVLSLFTDHQCKAAFVLTTIRMKVYIVRELPVSIIGLHMRGRHGVIYCALVRWYILMLPFNINCFYIIVAWYVLAGWHKAEFT